MKAIITILLLFLPLQIQAFSIANNYTRQNSPKFAFKTRHKQIYWQHQDFLKIARFWQKKDISYNYHKFAFAHRQASKINIPDVVLVELYNLILDKADDFTFQDAIVMGATATIESRWNPKALSPDGKDIGMFQSRCSALGTICAKKYKFKKRLNKKQKRVVKRLFTTEQSFEWYVKHVKQLKAHYKLLRGRFNTKTDNSLSSINYHYMMLYPGYAENRYKSVRQKRINMIENYIRRYQKAELMFDMGLQELGNKDLKTSELLEKFTIRRLL